MSGPFVPAIVASPAAFVVRVYLGEDPLGLIAVPQGMPFSTGHRWPESAEVGYR
jgi:hypothetical protein